MPAFARFAWGVVVYNLLVVVWGALVRATGSGAGCGKHWPTCNGEFVPRSPRAETAIEFAHRATSGIALVLVVALAAWAFRAFPRGHAARKAAVASFAFMIAEALVGAGLVLYGWVAKDASAGRGLAVPVHLANTFLLLASLALTAEWGRGPAPAAREGRPGPTTARGASAARGTAALALSLAAILVAGATGAVAALGDTLFPAQTLAGGLRQELSAGASVLLRLRILHPVAALAAGIVLLATARAAARRRPEPRVERAALAASALVAAQIGAGVLNVVLLAPVPLQLVHLLLADLTWLALVLLAAAALSPVAGAEPGAASAPVAAP